MKSWFGYGLHADTKYEIPVAFSVTQASRAETKELNGDKLFEETSLLRCKDFSAGTRQRAAQGEAAVRPVARASREEKNDPDKPVVRPLFDDNVYQRGEVLCRCPETGARRRVPRL